MVLDQIDMAHTLL